MKKLTGILTALTMLCTMGVTAFAEGQTFAQGDVDMDGILTGHDAAIVSQYADGVLKLTLSDEQLSLADMNGDGEITQDDAAIIAEKQEYKLGDVDLKGGLEIADATQILKFRSLKILGSDITFGSEEIRADFDCNGVIDTNDACLILSIYAPSKLGMDIYDEGKYYIIEPSEDSYNGVGLYGVESSECSSWEDFCEKVEKAFISTMLDTDGDSKVTVSDASKILETYSQNAAGIYQAANESKLDVNGDGEVNIDDATLVLKGYAMKAAGLL